MKCAALGRWISSHLGLLGDGWTEHAKDHEVGICCLLRAYVASCAGSRSTWCCPKPQFVSGYEHADNGHTRSAWRRVPVAGFLGRCAIRSSVGKRTASGCSPKNFDDGAGGKPKDCCLTVDRQLHWATTSGPCFKNGRKSKRESRWPTSLLDVREPSSTIGGPGFADGWQ